MMAFALIPTFVVWLITYGAVKYPAQALGRLVVRRSPNMLFDICICIGVTLLCWGGVVGMMTIVYVIGQDDRPTPMPIGTMVALGLAPPLFVAFFKATLRARSTSGAL